MGLRKPENETSSLARLSPILDRLRIALATIRFEPVYDVQPAGQERTACENLGALMRSVK